MVRGLFVLALSLVILPFAHADEESRKGCEKAATIWNDKIVPTVYAKGELPALKVIDPFQLLRIANPHTLSLSFAPQKGDELVGGRPKVIHAYGSVVRMRFDVPAKKDHSYTGLFQSGDECLLARLSLGEKQTAERSVPALAIKFFLDGQPSQNIVVMNTTDGQKGHNFFEKTFSNRLIPAQTEARILIAKEFRKGMELAGAEDTNPDHLSIDHLAKYDSHGVPVKAPSYPEKIVLKPSDYANKLMANAKATDDFRKLLSEFKSGEKMYDVVAEEAGKEIVLGSLVTTSEMVASHYADHKLYFRHYTKLKDAK